LNPIYLINLAAQQASWASTRQATITGNIANANTGGYTALDVEPFQASLDALGSSGLARTNPAHMGDDAEQFTGATIAVSDSGAPVSLDQELVKADDTNRTFALDTTIMRAFQQMLMMSVRS
jgi:flagellar basal-body rod protein FlgB